MPQDRMNTEWVAFHIGEARDILDALKARVESGSLDSMEELDLGTMIAEAWGNLNAAWNGRRDLSLIPHGMGGLTEGAFQRLRAAAVDLTPI